MFTFGATGSGHRGRTRHRGCTKLVHVRAPGFGHRGHTKLPLGAGLADRRRVDQRLADLRRRRRAVAVGPGRDAGVVRGAAASNIHTRPPPVTQHFNPGPQRSSPGSRASPASSAGPRSGSGEVSSPYRPSKASPHPATFSTGGGVTADSGLAIGGNPGTFAFARANGIGSTTRPHGSPGARPIPATPRRQPRAGPRTRAGP